MNELVLEDDVIALPTRIAGVDDPMYYHPVSEDAIVHAETLKAHRAIGWSTPTATPTNKQQMRGFSAALTFSTTIQPHQHVRLKRVAHLQ